jgi:hypothetical protein
MVESKEDIRKRLGRSTDSGDAVVQAFWVEPKAAPFQLQIGRVSRTAVTPERIVRERQERRKRKQLVIQDGRRTVIIR